MPHSIIVSENGGPEVMKWTEVSLQNPGKGEVRIDQKKLD
jgi:NADPH:quinone reductase-like Zn-dependent oxidoreductase